jgi:hypothetical protein
MLYNCKIAAFIIALLLNFERLSPFVIRTLYKTITQTGVPAAAGAAICCIAAIKARHNGEVNKLSHYFTLHIV